MPNISRYSKNINNASNKLKEFKQRMSMDNFKKKASQISESQNCETCKSEMVLDYNGYVCKSCGRVGNKIESVTTTYATRQGYSMSPYVRCDGVVCSTTGDGGNNVCETIFKTLTNSKKNDKDFPISFGALRDTAREYAKIIENVRNTPGHLANKRFNMIIPAILKGVLDKQLNSARTDEYIQGYLGICKKAMTHSKNKHSELAMCGVIEPVTDIKKNGENRLLSFAGQFLNTLGMDDKYAALVIDIVERADAIDANNIHLNFIGYSIRNDKSKVVGAIWLIIRQTGLNIVHDNICKKLKISKSTYTSYVDFHDINRRKINPTLVKYNLQPIPKEFAENSGRKKIKKMTPPAQSQFIWYGVRDIPNNKK